MEIKPEFLVFSGLIVPCNWTSVLDDPLEGILQQRCFLWLCFRGVKSYRAEVFSEYFTKLVGLSCSRLSRDINYSSLARTAIAAQTSLIPTILGLPEHRLWGRTSN